MMTMLPPYFRFFPIKTIILIFCICISSFSLAQTPQFEFFSSADYLSSTNPVALTQDEDGFIWVFSGGVDRYDGYQFVNIKNLEKNYQDYIFDSDFFISSKGHHIKKSKQYFYFRQIKTGLVDSIFFADKLGKDRIVSSNFFHETLNKEYYTFFCDTINSTLSFIKFEDGELIEKFTHADIFHGRGGAFRITSDYQKNFYVLNKDQSHFLKIDTSGNLLQKIPCPDELDDLSFFKIGTRNTLFFGRGHKLFFLDEHTKKIEKHPICNYTKFWGESIQDILELENGDLWIVGGERNLIYYDQSKNEVIDYREYITNLIPHQTNLSNILQDKTGVLWINTFLGIIKITPQQNLFDTYVTEQNSDCGGYCSFRGITEDDNGQIYASCYSKIFQIDPKSKTFKNPFPQYTNTPMGLGYSDGFIITNNGERLNSNSKKLDKNFSPIRDYRFDSGFMTEDNLGNWWNAQINDIWFLDTQTEKPEWKRKFEIPGCLYRINIHFGKKSKKLWIGDGDRLFYFDIEKQQLLKILSLPQKENIISLYEDKDGTIWLGTDAGLIAFEPSQKEMKRFSTKNGLSNDLVCGILSEGDSCLWLATNNGLCRFQIEKENFINFYTSEGLSHNEFNRGSTYHAKDGQMFFGGMQGVNAFYPQEVMQKYLKQKNIGKVMLSSVTRTDEKLDTVITKGLALNESNLEFHHWDKSITLEFFLSDYRKSEKNQFVYLLEGYNEVWSKSSTLNFANFSSLPAGNYTFRVKAFDAKGYWNPNELAIPIKVYPPWWQTSWAYLIYALLLGGILFGTYRVLLYRMALKNRIQFEQEEARRLKELDSFKSRLFTNLTHEFRTPLTVILGMSKQISKTANGLQIDNNTKTSLSEQAELIEKNGKGLLRLVNQLLDLSKLESNAFHLNLKNGDVLPFLSYVVSSFQSYANQQNLILNFSSESSNLPMDFDANCLQQVMTNLVSNAIKFTNSGGEINVSIRTIKGLENDFLQIEIRDTGIGINAEKLPHIFDRFYQVDGSTTRAGEGTGIGLAHTKELVKLMEGEIKVESVLNKGTTFLVKLPIKNELQRKETPNDNLIIENNPRPNDFILQRQRVDKIAHKINSPNKVLPKLLLIEDNPDVVTYLKSCLEKDYELDVALNGRIGIEKAFQNIPDLIISDVMMPEKDGYEVCDTLKNDEKTSHIPIVLLTAKADVASRIAGLKRGADAYLAKPFLQEELEIRLQALLRQQQRFIQYFSSSPISKEEEIADDSIQVENVFLQKIESILEENYMEKDFTLPFLCQKIGMSRSQLFRKIKALTGTSPSGYIRSYRLKKAKTLLESQDFNVSEVAWKTGFSSLPHFSRVFQEEFNTPPSEVLIKK